MNETILRIVFNEKWRLFLTRYLRASLDTAQGGNHGVNAAASLIESNSGTSIAITELAKNVQPPACSSTNLSVCVGFSPSAPSHFELDLTSEVGGSFWVVRQKEGRKGGPCVSINVKRPSLKEGGTAGLISGYVSNKMFQENQMQTAKQAGLKNACKP